MTQNTYYKAKAIMDEIERLNGLKKFDAPPECFSIVFKLSGKDIEVGCLDIGTDGITKLINTYSAIIDNLVDRQLRRLEEI